MNNSENKTIQAKQNIPRGIQTMMDAYFAGAYGACRILGQGTITAEQFNKLIVNSFSSFYKDYFKIPSKND